MIHEWTKPKMLVFVLTAFLAPFPTYAIDGTGSGDFWGIIISFFIAGFFLAFALLPWLTYRAIKNGRLFWIVLTLILCIIGIFYSVKICIEIFSESGMAGFGLLTLLFSCSIYIILFFKTLYKLSEFWGEFNLSLIGSGNRPSEPINDQVPANNLFLYQKYSNENEVFQLIGLLKNHNIEYQLEDHSPVPDIIFSMNVYEKEFWLKLKKEDFGITDKIQADFLNTLKENIDPEYYLFDLTNAELSEIIKNPNEWSQLDFQLAQKILKDRGEL